MTKQPPLFGSFAGIRNTVAVERLAPTDLADAVNVDIADDGRVTLRPGRTVQVAGSAHSIWSDGDVCLFAQSGALKQLASDLTTSTTLASGLSDDPISYLQVNGRVYHTNGRVTGVWDGGVVRTWGMEIPEPPAASATIGDLAAGTYHYAMTRIRADGQESGAGMAVRMDLDAGSGIVFTWTAQSGSMAIYLSEPNGEAMFRAAVVDATLGTYTYHGGPRAVVLSTQFLDAPPAGQALAESNGRIYIAKGEFIYPTNALGYEYCDLRDYLAIDGTTIRFLAGLPGGIFVGTERAVYFLPGGRLEDMGLRAVVKAPGIARSVVYGDGGRIIGPQAAGQRVAMFTTGLGVCVGLSDGALVNITQERFNFDPPATASAALRDEDQFVQYLLTA